MPFFNTGVGGKNLPSITYGQISEYESASGMPHDYDLNIYFSDRHWTTSAVNTNIYIYRISEKAKKYKRLRAQIYYRHQQGSGFNLTGKNCTLTTVSKEASGTTTTYVVEITDMTGDYSTITIVNGNITMSAGIEIIEAE